MSNKDLRTIDVPGLPDGYVAMAEARLEEVEPGLVGVTVRMTVSDPTGQHHGVILQFFVMEPGEPG